MANYQPMQNPVADWSDIGAMILRARQAAKEQDSKRAELLLRQENSNRENARLDEQMRHTSELENHQRQVDVATVLPKVKAMLTPGDPSYDPETGMSMARAYGINLSAMQPTMPTAPEMPQDKPVPQLNGDLDAVSGGAPQQEIKDNTALDATRATMQGDYQKQLAAAQRRAPTYSGTSPIGPVSIDPNAAVTSREERTRQQREQMSPLGEAVDENFRPVVMAMVQAGMPPAEIAKTVGEYRKQMATDARDTQYKPTVAKQDEWHQMMYRAAMANARARGAQAGDVDPAVGAAISKHLTENPGDFEGAFKVAGAMNSAAPGKTVQTVAGLTKPTEGQAKSAEQAAQGLRAVDAIGKSGFVPSDKDIQQWIDNQRSVQRAEDLAKSGMLGTGAAGVGQWTGLLKRSEFDNMSPQAAEYFTNVRRMMEPLARKQSGAAIAESEWRNFFNQYGPMSPGGIDAARRDLTDLARGGGVATRQLAPRQPSKNETRADTLKRGGKRKSLEELEKESGL